MTTLTRQLRIAQNLTQEALAKKALVTRYVVRTLESPEWHKIEPQHIKLVADALGVSTEVLLGKKTYREEDLEFEIKRLKDSYNNKCMHNTFLMEDLVGLRTQNQLLRLALAIGAIILSLTIIL